MGHPSIGGGDRAQKRVPSTVSSPPESRLLVERVDSDRCTIIPPDKPRRAGKGGPNMKPRVIAAASFAGFLAGMFIAAHGAMDAKVRTAGPVIRNTRTWPLTNF